MFGRKLFLAGIARDNESDSVGKLVVEVGMRKLDPPSQYTDNSELTPRL